MIKSQRKAQGIVDSLCSRYGIPSIPVIIKSSLGGTADAFFDPSTWSITFERGVSLKILKHEFGHYVTHLSFAAESAEDQLCDVFAKS